MTANRDYNEGHLGFYVVNKRTEIAVAGPLTYEPDAHAEADRRNALEPATPGLLEVVEIVRSTTHA